MQIIMYVKTSFLYYNEFLTIELINDCLKSLLGDHSGISFDSPYQRSNRTFTKEQNRSRIHQLENGRKGMNVSKFKFII